jgi:MFS family permease
MHRVGDWRQSQLITGEQRDRMAADLETGLRRTNVFLRLTLFVLGVLIALAAALFLAILFEVRDAAIWIVAALAGGACYAAAMFLVNRYRFYRFGIEEAFASVAVLLAGVAVGFLAGPYFDDDISIGIGFVAASVTAFVVFFQFGYVYAAVIAMAGAAVAPFPILEADMASRLIGVAVLAACFFAARLERADYGDDFPGDSYAIVETAAWGGVYFLLNLKVSSWLAQPDDFGVFYWITYALIWMMPLAGIWIAIRERHRVLLDLNIVLAIATLMSNKPYLGAEQRPWDPITFGLLLIAVALGLRRWLDRGEGGARHGFVSYRVLASDRDRLSAVGNVSIMQPSLHPQHAPEHPKPGFGGGSSGGAGSSGTF